MRLSIVKNVGLLVLAVVGIASRSHAATIITVPLGLNPGDTYRLVFVTSASTDATSGNIDYYNAFVTAAADDVPELAALAATWFVIGSTAAESAINNIGIDVGVPIYDLAGTRIASDAGTGAGGLFGGTILSAIEIDEFGNAHPYAFVWSGTLAGGGQQVGRELGEVVHTPTPSSTVGLTGRTDYHWIFDTYALLSLSEPLYGISGVLTVPGSTTPEPATTGMVIAAGALMFFAGRRDRRPL